MPTAKLSKTTSQTPGENKPDAQSVAPGFSRLEQVALRIYERLPYESSPVMAARNAFSWAAAFMAAADNYRENDGQVFEANAEDHIFGERVANPSDDPPRWGSGNTDRVRNLPPYGRWQPIRSLTG